jgi:Fungal specific transcription factor domain
MHTSQSERGPSVDAEEGLESYPMSTEAFLSVSKMNESHEKGFFGARLLMSDILSTDGGNPFKTVVLRSTPMDIFSFSSADELSSMQLRVLSEHGDALIEIYEKTIHIFYPFMPMSVIKELLLHLQAPHPSAPTSSISNFARFSLFIILSITLLLGGDDVPFAEHFEGQFFFSALSGLKAILELGPPLDCIRALLLLSIYSLYKPSAGSSWHFVGFAMRTCVLQGYHSRQRVPVNVEGADESTRWAFWSCYALERTLCLTLDRLPSISDSDITITVRSSLTPEY